MIAHVVATEREGLIQLLTDLGWLIPSNTSDRMLTGIVLESLEQNTENTTAQLTHLLQPMSNFTGPQIGVDPVSAIAGAIGSVANLVRSATNRKQVKQQAQAATLAALIQARTPQVIFPGPPRRVVWPWIVGGVLLLGSIALVILLNSQKG